VTDQAFHGDELRFPLPACNQNYATLLLENPENGQLVVCFVSGNYLDLGGWRKYFRQT
jgi:hypothetical protein